MYQSVVEQRSIMTTPIVSLLSSTTMEYIRERYGDRLIVEEGYNSLFGDQDPPPLYTNSVFRHKWHIRQYGTDRSNSYLGDEIACMGHMRVLHMNEDDWASYLENDDSDESEGIRKVCEVMVSPAHLPDWVTLLDYSQEEGSISWYINKNPASPYFQHVVQIAVQHDHDRYLGHLSHVIANMDTCVFDTLDELDEYDRENYRHWDDSFLLRFLKEHPAQVDFTKLAQYLRTQIIVYGKTPEDRQYIQDLFLAAPDGFIHSFVNYLGDGNLAVQAVDELREKGMTELADTITQHMIESKRKKRRA
jgi:hypothetical protein